MSCSGEIVFCFSLIASSFAWWFRKTWSCKRKFSSSKFVVSNLPISNNSKNLVKNSYCKTAAMEHIFNTLQLYNHRKLQNCDVHLTIVKKWKKSTFLKLFLIHLLFQLRKKCLKTVNTVKVLPKQVKMNKIWHNSFLWLLKTICTKYEIKTDEAALLIVQKTIEQVERINLFDCVLNY